MPRNLATPNLDVVVSQNVPLVLLVRLDFTGETVYIASTPFDIVWDSHTWLGVGFLGSVSGISEDGEVRATATTLTLSGIPSELVSDALDVVKFGGKAQLYVGFLNDGSLVTDPIPANLGLIDAPALKVGGQTCSITITIESEMSDLQRSRGGRLTAQDQRSRYTWDASLDIVSKIQDKLLLWK